MGCKRREVLTPEVRNAITWWYAQDPDRASLPASEQADQLKRYLNDLGLGAEVLFSLQNSWRYLSSFRRFMIILPLVFVAGIYSVVVVSARTGRDELLSQAPILGLIFVLVAIGLALWWGRSFPDEVALKTLREEIQVELPTVSQPGQRHRFDEARILEEVRGWYQETPEWKRMSFVGQTKGVLARMESVGADHETMEKLRKRLGAGLGGNYWVGAFICLFLAFVVPPRSWGSWLILVPPLLLFVWWIHRELLVAFLRRKAMRSPNKKADRDNPVGQKVT